MKIQGISTTLGIAMFIVAILIIAYTFLPKNNIIHRKIVASISSKHKADFGDDEFNSFEKKIVKKLHVLEVAKDDIITTFNREKNIKEIHTSIPLGQPDEWIIWQLYQSTQGTAYTVHDSYYEKLKKKYILLFKSINKKETTIKLSFSKDIRFLSNSSKMAIVIEDFLFKADAFTMEFLSFPEPLTISLIPTNTKTELTAQIAKEYKKEILIQLTFEPQKKITHTPSFLIMIHYPEEKIRRIISDAIKIIPDFSGFSHCNESIALGDSRIMRIVLQEVKKHKSFFLSTYESKNNVLPEITSQLHVPYLKISHKIHEESNVKAIEKALKVFGDIARNNRSIVISAKASYSFIQAIKNVYPLMRKRGIQLVYVSEILKNKTSNISLIHEQ